MPEVTTQQLEAAQNAPVYAADGEQIGHVGEFWYDESGRPQWLKIGSGFLGLKNRFVPVQGAELREDGLFVPYTKDQITSSPEQQGEDLTGDYEQQLSGSYGLAESADTVTRSEEELHVGKETVEAGRVRLRKYVETEPVELDVDLKRETARVTREPINEPVAEHDFEEGEVEVPLHAEQAVVAKQAVAKERIGVETNVETERQTVRDELKKERVEVEGETPEARS
jgi:uncharacterized protein (TIGR02271 family)